MSIGKLLSVASQGLGPKASPSDLMSHLESHGNIFAELAELLSLRNGFYAFESALHVFPCASLSGGDDLSLREWNSPALWKEWYQGGADNLFCFAEDVFGGQFAIRDDNVVSFDPESGEVNLVAKTIADWVEIILSDYNLLTGFPLAHQWQTCHGPLSNNKRLIPKIPFILGGEFLVSNLVEIDSVEGMRYRGEIYEQIKNAPDGSSINLKPVPFQ